MTEYAWTDANNEVRFKGLPNPAFVALRRVVSVTSAQILAWHTTAVQLLPAPGAGIVAFPLNIYGVLTAGSAAYDTTGTGNLDLAWGAVGGAGDLITLGGIASLITASSSSFAQEDTGSLLDAAEAATSVMANAAVNCGFVTANPTAGNGTLVLYVDYTLVPTS